MRTRHSVQPKLYRLYDIHEKQDLHPKLFKLGYESETKNSASTIFSRLFFWMTTTQPIICTLPIAHVCEVNIIHYSACIRA